MISFSLSQVLQWRFYGAMLFTTHQEYSVMLPKALWIAVYYSGIAVLAQGLPDPLFDYSYEDILNYSASMRCFMLIAGYAQ